MLKNIRRSTLGAAARMGGFIGWYLTVMYICEQSLRFYRDDTMLGAVNITFLLSSGITAAGLSVLLLLLDIEGLLSDKILRWLPGIFMAESGIALSLANASTMTAFSAVAGFASVFGALAVLSHLLRVKVGQRMTAVALGLALGGVIRLLAVALIGTSPTKISLMAAAIAIGLLAALSVHSNGYSQEGSPLVSLAEAEPRQLLRRIPGIYVLLALCSALFYFAHSHVETLTVSGITGTYTGYAAVASLGFIAAAAAALCVRLPWIPMLFVFGAGLSAASSILAGLPYLTSSEAGFFAFISYAALACVKAGFFIIVLLFSLDRPHPLFYTFLGYTAVITGELLGRVLDRFVTRPGLSFYIWLLVLLTTVGGGLIAYFTRRAGFTQEQLEHRHNTRSMIRRRARELGLSTREQVMVEHIVLEGYGPGELSSKMLYSRNTVKVMLRTLLPKFGAESLEALRSHFGRLTENEERFLAEVQAAEADRRAADRAQQAQRRREELERRRDEKIERAAAREREIAEQEAALEIVDVTLGEDEDEAGAAAEETEAAGAIPHSGEGECAPGEDADEGTDECEDDASDDTVPEDIPEEDNANAGDPETGDCSGEEADEDEAADEDSSPEDSDTDRTDTPDNEDEDDFFAVYTK